MRVLRSLLRSVRPMLGLAGGLVLVGVSGYAFTVAVAWVYPAQSGSEPRVETAVTAYYFLVTTVLLGVYNGLDQVTNRRVAHTLATGARLRPALLRAVRDALGLTAAVGAVLLAASPILVGNTLKGQFGLFTSLLVGIVLAAAASVVRGVLAGSQRFGAYGMVWGVEGASRLVLTAVVAASGSKAAWLFGYAFVLPYAISALAGLVACRNLRTVIRRSADRGRDGADTARNLDAASEAAEGGGSGSGGAAGMGLIALSTAGLLTTAVANLPYLVLTSRSPSGSDAIAAFGQAFLIARIALTVLTPFQSMLLPAFTREAALGNVAGLRRRLRGACAVCAVVGAMWAAAVTAGGPWTVENVFNKPASVVPSVPAFLALGSGTILFAVASAIQPAIVAVGRYRDVPAIWALGLATTVAGAFCPGLSPTGATVTAALAGPAAVLIGMGVSAQRGLAAPSAPVLPENAGSDLQEMVYSHERVRAPKP